MKKSAIASASVRLRFSRRIEGATYSTRHRHIQGGGQEARALPIEKPPTTKMRQKAYVSSLKSFQHFSRITYTRTTVMNNNIDDQRARDPQFKFCQHINPFICVSRAKLRLFVLRVAISGPHLPFL